MLPREPVKKLPFTMTDTWRKTYKVCHAKNMLSSLFKRDTFLQKKSSVIQGSYKNSQKPFRY